MPGDKAKLCQPERRTAKTYYPLNQDELPETVTFHWQGMQMCGETSDRKADEKILYLYNPSSYEPIARIDYNQKTTKQQVYYYHTQLNGLPEELTNQQGHIVWRGGYHLWGKLQYSPQMTRNTIEQNLRFAGQYADNDKSVGNRFEQRKRWPVRACLKDETSKRVCITIHSGITTRKVVILLRVTR